MQYKGKFITIEGIDGCGKSTLAKNLAQTFIDSGSSVVLTKEPGGSELGKHLRKILQEQTEPVCNKSEYLLFAADRAQHFIQTILPALEQGKIVISDRWADSSVAYQGYGRGLDVEMIKSINAWATNNLLPNLVLYIKIDPKTALARVEKRNIELTAFEKEKTEFWSKVCAGYEKIYANRKEVKTLDGKLTQEDLMRSALEVLDF